VTETSHPDAEVLADGGPSLPYRHDQRLYVSQLELVAARGLRRGVGLQVILPLRHVTTRIDFTDPIGRPFPTQEGPLHHRDETLLGPADPWLLVQAGRAAGTWRFGVRGGVTVPLGRTEPDPMALGDAGQVHQHIQFGTGTWDPLLGAAVSRRAGRATLTLQGMSRFVVGTNEHGYRAGHRAQAGLAATIPLGDHGHWRVQLGLDVAHEAAERWHGHEGSEEGNLGRTDWLIGAGVGHGRWTAGLQVPVVTRVVGAQLDYPVVVSVGWSR
jgi:hypothetical protein